MPIFSYIHLCNWTTIFFGISSSVVFLTAQVLFLQLENRMIHSLYCNGLPWKMCRLCSKWHEISKHEVNMQWIWKCVTSYNLPSSSLLHISNIKNLWLVIVEKSVTKILYMCITLKDHVFGKHEVNNQQVWKCVFLQTKFDYFWFYFANYLQITFPFYFLFFKISFNGLSNIQVLDERRKKYSETWQNRISVLCINLTIQTIQFKK